MLYLPRLFIYHCDAEIGSKQSETFKIMERRLFKAIINPAMMVAWLAGLYMMVGRIGIRSGWFQGKLAFVHPDVRRSRLFRPPRTDFGADRNSEARNSIVLSMR